MVSVIIPSYNSENTIESCLTSLRNQTFKEAYEIILVDSSNDNTPEIVRSDFSDIIFIHLDEKTDPGTARNLGFEKSSGDPILFIDSDCIAAPGWIKKMVELHRSTDYYGIGGGVKNGNDQNCTVACAGYMAEFREFLPEQPCRIVKHIPTCNISYKREALEKLGGFNPDYYPQEDLDFNHRVQLAGRQILFDPDIQVSHHHRTNLSDFFIHQKRVGMITSRMLRILPLEGAKIARNKAIAIIAAPFMPLVKWVRTVGVFWKLNNSVIIKHPVAIVYLAMGLMPWTIGFLNGVFYRDHKIKENK